MIQQLPLLIAEGEEEYRRKRLVVVAGTMCHEQLRTAEVLTRLLGDPASDSRYERVQERTPKSPTQEGD